MLTNQPNNTTLLPECRWASFYLVRALIKSLCYLTAGLSLFPAQLWLAIAVYITGLVTHHNVTVTAIAASVGILSHDQLSRMLQSLSWSISQGAILSVRLVEALGFEGYLIIDDVLIPKPFASKISFCFWDHDHSLKRHTFGKRLVFKLLRANDAVSEDGLLNRGAQSRITLSLDAFVALSTKHESLLVSVEKDPNTGKVPENWHQRLSELRTDSGYTILSWRNRGDLKVQEYLMPHAENRAKAGKRVNPTNTTWVAVLKRANLSLCFGQSGSQR